MQTDAEQMPKCIRAVTPRGFELKAYLFCWRL
jgi:hypothetical protein